MASSERSHILTHIVWRVQGASEPRCRVRVRPLVHRGQLHEAGPSGARPSARSTEG
ncbi:hypothetical protein KI387_040173, partial [Taxus chinensis]